MKCNTLRQLWVPDTVTSDCSCLCEGAINLRFAKLPCNMTHPGIAIFNGCASLEEIVLPEGILYIGENMFAGCKSLHHITLPSSIDCLCGEAFAGSGIVEIVLPENLKRIRYDAFVECRSLKNISIPRNVQEIDGWFIQGHSHFDGIECFSPHFRIESECLISNKENALISSWSKNDVLYIPESVQIIRSICNDQIKKIVINHPITKIERDALCYNPNLTEIIYNYDIAEIEESYGCEHIIGFAPQK